MRTSSVRLTMARSSACDPVRLFAWLSAREYDIALDEEMPPSWQPAIAMNGPWVVMRAHYKDPTPIQRSVGIEAIKGEPVLSMMSEAGCVPILQDHETEIPPGCYILIKEKRR